MGPGRTLCPTLRAESVLASAVTDPLREARTDIRVFGNLELGRADGSPWQSLNTVRTAGDVRDR